MTTEHRPHTDATRLERSFDAPPELLWELLTTAAGLEQWWAPDGFETRVRALALVPGGLLEYTMTAVAPDQVAFLRDIGQPVATDLHKTFTEVVRPTRLAYLSPIDFVPDHEPYDHLTTVDLEAAGDGTRMIVTLDPLHDAAWTAQHHAHRGSELDTLAAVVRRWSGGARAAGRTNLAISCEAADPEFADRWPGKAGCVGSDNPERRS
ncbi:SRPBCC domain-containing protein [Nocardia sp. BMG111209]|uniref:SRPBCC family protein n=1 Tax=Nocardia sp. BMG111209 TaxID=1160137 RepID=UPI0009DBCCB0|nr:SRPBCC domain-containing protein [Nocardia sp. BMG111209]